VGLGDEVVSSSSVLSVLFDGMPRGGMRFDMVQADVECLARERDPVCCYQQTSGNSQHLKRITDWRVMLNLIVLELMGRCGFARGQSKFRRFFSESSGYYKRWDGQMFRTFRVLVALVVALPLVLTAQMTPGGSNIIVDKYFGVTSPQFRDYFTHLVEKYQGTDASAWGIYFESPTTAYRITPVPAESRLMGVSEVLDSRMTGFQDFTERERELWGTAWNARQTTLWIAQPELSYLPDDMSIGTIEDNPYSRVMFYRLKRSDVQKFQNALKRRGELDRELGIDDLILRVYRGGLGTRGPVYMLRFHDENMEAAARDRAARGAARQGIMEEWQAANRAMNQAAWNIEMVTNFRANNLSRNPN